MDGTSPRLSAVTLTVRDVAASIAFYRKLGVAIPDDSAWVVDGKPHHVAVHLENGLGFELDSIALTKGFDTDWTQADGPSRNVLVFNVATRDAVDALYADLTSGGAAGQKAPFDAFWGARYAVVEDPDANRVGIMSPMEEQHKSAPPEL